MKKLAQLFASMVLSLALVLPAMAQESMPVSNVLITNANILDTNKGTLVNGMSLLVEGNKIAKVGKSIPAPAGATVIDANGLTLMPGLIDAHLHLVINDGNFIGDFYQQPDYLAALALVEANNTLMRGFTSVRDTGGRVLGVKKAIDQGYFPGPRIWAAGAGMTMTGGHADLRPTAQQPRLLGGPTWTDVEFGGGAVIADGVPEVLSAARLQMRNGSHFLKMFTSGAVSGMYDPLDIGEYSFDEIKAAADEAKRWNTYLAVHTYNDKGTQLALQAGAMSIEHGNLMSEETMKLLVAKGAFMSAQTGVFLDDPDPKWSDDLKSKQLIAREGLDNMFKLAKKHKAKIALGTDYVNEMGMKKGQAYELTNRLQWFTPAEIIKQATVNNAELLTMSGPRNPYPGKLGVIEEGAYADILLVDGNPLENLTVFNDPEKNLLLIMKDGKVYKNTVK